MEKDYAKIRAEAKLAETRSRHREAMRYLTISIVVIAAVLLAWQLAVQLGLVSTRFFDSPVGVVKTIITKITDKKPDGGLLLQHIWASAKVVWLGFLLAAVIGVPLGLFMGWFRLCDRIIRPLFEIIRPIPSLAWIPIVLLFLGIGVKARAVIIFTGCFVATVLNTYTGVRSTDQTLINVAKTCGAGNFKTFCKVGIPSAMPMIFAGLKTSMGSAWGTIVAAEMLASSNGLGYMIQMGRSFGKVSLIMAGIIVIGILGFISSGLIDLAEGIVLKWRPKK
ncbi:MAG: ABC transporter permease [Oscillospiraceae bacterium]|nr:ABC transporter permease [Oscillospiraceae bacterium]